jgi:hypothetical protein
LQAGLELSVEAFQSLSLHLEKHTQQWLTQDQHAQINRNADPSVMDMYDTATAKGMHMNMIEQASMPTDMCRTISFRHSRDSYLRGRW